MMKRIIYSYLIPALLLLASCSEKGLRTDSENAIRLTVDVPQTRATLFEGAASLLNEEIGGGDFTVSAYVAGDGTNAGKQYIADARVNYFKDADDWRFATESDGRISYFDYYWPKGEKLNFFAHMPMDKSKGAVTGKGYTDGKPWFSFSLPLYAYDPDKGKDPNVPSSSPNQETLREFIYAYTPDQDKATQDAADGVQLQFRHPFAALYFDLGKSYRMELKSLTVWNVYYEGTYLYDGSEWGLEPTTGTNSLYISIMQDVPSDDLNFYSNIGGPYIVMPQDMDKDDSDVENDVKLSIIGSRLGGEVYNRTVSLSGEGLPERWEAGMKYTYTLNLGEADEEILFKVSVEEWDVVGYKNEIDVE